MILTRFVAFVEKLKVDEADDDDVDDDDDDAHEDDEDAGD